MRRTLKIAMQTLKKFIRSMPSTAAVALCLAVPVWDAAAFVTRDALWLAVGSWSLLVGVVGWTLASAVGTFDFWEWETTRFSGKRGLRRIAGAFLPLAAFLVSLIFRLDPADMASAPPLPACIVALAATLLFAAGKWADFEPVPRRRRR